MIPKVPSNPSVSLSESDLGYIRMRRRMAFERRRAVLLSRAVVVAVGFGAYFLALGFLGGAV
mgnify:CR=1 FL=1